MTRRVLWSAVMGLVLGLALLAFCAWAARSPGMLAIQPSPTARATVLPVPTATAPPTATALPTPTPKPPLVAIDPGHGGADPGGQHYNAQGVLDLTEASVNLQIALLLRDKLEARGYRVYLTRDTDDFPGEPLQDWNNDGEVTIRDDLQLRTDRVNEQGADLFVSLHENALDGPDPATVRRLGGTTTYYCADRPFAEQNLRLATLVHQEILAAIRSFGYEPADLGVIDDHQLETPTGQGQHLYILGPHDAVITRPSEMPGCLSEPLFITCEDEAALLAQADFREALAEAYANAITAYLEAEGQPPAAGKAGD